MVSLFFSPKSNVSNPSDPQFQNFNLILTFQVIAPTRELAQQTQKVVDVFGRSSNIRSVCLFGGVSRQPQINELQRGVDMVIATPGNFRVKWWGVKIYFCLKVVYFSKKGFKFNKKFLNKGGPRLAPLNSC